MEKKIKNRYKNIWTLFKKKKGKLPIVSCKMQKTSNIQYKQGCGEVSALIQWIV